MSVGSDLLLSDGVDLLNRESRFLDERLWDEWLGLYCEDCQFWAPAWRNDDELTSNFQREISIFFFQILRRTGGPGLADSIRAGAIVNTIAAHHACHLECSAW